MLEGIRQDVFEFRGADGKVYKLIFDMNAFAELESRMGTVKNIGLEDISNSEARIMLWAGLRTHHQELTPSDVGALFGPNQRAEIIEFLSAALASAFGPSKKAAGAKETERPTGP